MIALRRAIGCVALVLAQACAREPAEERISPAPEARIPVGPIPGPGNPVPPMSNPYGDDDAARQEGRRWFIRYNCSGCHGGHAGGGMGPSLRDVDWLYGQSDAAIFSSVSEGRSKGMPAWGGRIPDDQIWKLVSYIHSLRTANEPDPPT